MYSRLKYNQVNKSKFQPIHMHKQKNKNTKKNHEATNTTLIAKKKVNDITSSEQLIISTNSCPENVISNNILSTNTYIITERSCQNEQMIKNIIIDEIKNNVREDESRNVNILIKNLSVNTSMMCDITKHFITISGTFQSNNIKIHNLRGNIELNGINVNNNMYGNVSIFNTENGTIFNGMIIVTNGNIEYVLSNRPLIQMKTSFSGTISLFIKMAKTKIYNIVDNSICQQY